MGGAGTLEQHLETGGVEIAALQFSEYGQNKHRDMEKVRIKIDWFDHNYGAAPVNEDIACVATGSTLHEAERNIVDALKFHVEGLEPGEIPAELRGGMGSRV